MSKKILVLGAGVVGTAAAQELVQHSGLKVTLADYSQEQLAASSAISGAESMQLDITDSSKLITTLNDCDIVLGALPEALGFEVLSTAIGLGRDIVDVAFFEEHVASLNAEAIKSGCRAALDCGVAPGLSHMLVGQAAASFDSVEEVVIYVGGLPANRTLPWEYKAVFSPTGVLDEYTRPARVIEDGQIVVLEALSETELISFPEVGELEAFNTDGLRSLLHSLSAKRMREKTLRYPGHADKIRVLKDSGFFATDKILLNGVQVSPREFSSKILFPLWKLEAEEDDITIMRVEVSGRRAEKLFRQRFELCEKNDRSCGLSAMARTTGFTAAATLLGLLQGLGPASGLILPEAIGADQKFMKQIEVHLGRRSISWTRTEEEEESTI